MTCTFDTRFGFVISFLSIYYINLMKYCIWLGLCKDIAYLFVNCPIHFSGHLTANITIWLTERYSFELGKTLTVINCK